MGVGLDFSWPLWSFETCCFRLCCVAYAFEQPSCSHT